MRNGSSYLRFRASHGHTDLIDCFAELPLVVQRPLRGPAGQALVVLLTPAGALFDGDTLELAVECEPGTDVTLTTTAATKLNRCESGTISMTLHVRIGDGATFRYLPHQLIPFTAADYQQLIEVDVDADGRAELLEVITPGATNATFTFRQLVFETILRKPERVVAREKYRLTPRSRGQLAGYTHYGSLLLVGTGLDDERRKRLAECRMVQAGASELPGGGAVVKMLGRSAQTVRGALLDVLPYAAWVNRFFPL